MIFVDHLVHAAVLKTFLGNRCEVLAGSEMEDMARSTSAVSNRELVKRFNAGTLDVLIATPVGESSLDTYSNKFKFIIVFDAHGGPAAASQRLGRAARTTRASSAESTRATRRSRSANASTKKSATTTSSSRRSRKSGKPRTSAESNSKQKATKYRPSNTTYS